MFWVYSHLNIKLCSLKIKNLGKESAVLHVALGSASHLAGFLSPSQAMGTGSRVAPCPGTPLPSDTLLAKSSQGVGKSL